MDVKGTAARGVPEPGGEAIADILARASERARQAALEYIGLVTPQEAMQLMQAGNARLVDVRTPGERARAGRVRGSVAIAWHTKAALDMGFAAQLRRRIRPDEIVMFLSRGGVRSHHAARAAAEAGYVQALSVLEGYEGERVGGGVRRGGWRRRQATRASQPGARSALDEALEETFPASDPIAVQTDDAGPRGRQ